LSIIQIDLNNQRFPTSNSDFRRALAHLANKPHWAGTVFLGRATGIDTPVPYALEEFINPDVPTYSYSRDVAKQILDEAGFVNSTNDRYREGPNGEEIKLRMWSPHRWGDAGPEPVWPKLDMVLAEFREELDAVDIACEDISYTEFYVPREGIRVGSALTRNVYEVIDNRDYHFYVDNILVEPNIDYLFSLYHSDFIDFTAWSFGVPLGINWVGFNDQSYDSASLNLMHAQTWDQAKQYAYECQEILANEVAVIPLFAEIPRTLHLTSYGDWPYEERYKDSEWLHAINQEGEGFDSYSTFLNMHPAGYECGGNIRYGTYYDVAGIFSPFWADKKAEWTILDLLYEPLIRRNPYDQSEFVPWLATDYEVETWAAGKINVTIHLIPNILWHDHVTLTANDVRFTFDYMADEAWMYSVGWHSPKARFVDHVNVIDYRTVQIYFDVGIVALGWLCDFRILPEHVWQERDAFWNPADDDGLVGAGPYRFYKDDVPGRISRDRDGLIYLEANPTYFRKLVWPDVCDETHTPGAVDGEVDLDDIMEVAKPGNILSGENPDGTWPNPPGAWGPYCDVNKDGVIGTADIMECGVHIGKPWPPPWYADPPQYGTQSAEESLSSETVASDNAFSQASPANSYDPQISANPAIAVATPNTTFTVDITVSDVTDLYGWEFWMSFDPTVLSAVNVTEGPFLEVGGDTWWLTPRINNTAGTIAAGDLLWPFPSQGVSGSGTIATVTFYVQSDGATSLNFSKTELNTIISSNLVSIGHNATHGYAATTIQAAVDWAEAADTIHVTEGTYDEHVTVDKSLTLIGENAEATIIDGSGTNAVIRVTADDVTIRGFSIRNGDIGVDVSSCSQTYIANNIIGYNNIGVDVDNSSSFCIIKQNTISNNNQTGIKVEDYSSDNTVFNNTIQNNLCGIHVANQSHSNSIKDNVISSNSYGICLDLNVSNNMLYYNNITFNTDYGIAITDCTIENQICHNYISNNQRGVYLKDTSNQVIRSNEISNNQFGINPVHSDNNVVYCNNFIDNSFQVKSIQSANIWDDGFGSDGNFWSDYNGTGPYVIDENNQDNFPLLEPRSPLIGDVDGDWDVDNDDLDIIGEHLPEQYPTWDPYWGPRCDVAGLYYGSVQPIPDGLIDIDDLMITAMHRGDTWPPP